MSRRAHCAAGLVRPTETHCPLLTKQCKSVEELSCSEVPEIRCARLNKALFPAFSCVKGHLTLPLGPCMEQLLGQPLQVMCMRNMPCTGMLGSPHPH